MLVRRDRPNNWKSLIVYGVLLLLLFTQAACVGLDFLLDGAVREHVSGDWIHVYFTNPRYPDEEDDRYAGLDEDLAALLDQAENTVDLVAYDFDLESLAEALIAAEERGVRVRMVVESDNVLSNEHLLVGLERAGIPVIEDKRQSGLMHNKFVVIDEQWVFTGSWNMTENGTYRNNNNAVLIASPALAENYTIEFGEMLGREFGPTSPADTPHPRVLITVEKIDEAGQSQERQVEVESYFAPEDDTAAAIVENIEDAQHRIRFMTFVFTSEEIADAMIERSQAGVTVQGVMEDRNLGSGYSQYERLRRQVHDVLPDGNPYIMHHKVIIIDDETVITGSYNFTKSAEESNDENVLIIHDPEVAALYVEEFGRVYEQARE
jgi:phosphatidylserine/phosphatidylglycerophosphate/cardiolipin synthase-like enzyme